MAEMHDLAMVIAASFPLWCPMNTLPFERSRRRTRGTSGIKTYICLPAGCQGAERQKNLRQNLLISEAEELYLGAAPAAPKEFQKLWRPELTLIGQDSLKVKIISDWWFITWFCLR